MHIRETQNSEEKFLNQFIVLATAGVSLFHIRSGEVSRALSCLRKRILADGGTYKEWDVVRGTREIELSNYDKLHDIKGDGNIDLLGALSGKSGPEEQLAKTREGVDVDKVHYFVYVNPQFYWESNPQLFQMLMDFSATLPWSNVKIIFVTPDIPIEDSLGSYFHTLSLDPPSTHELLDSFQAVIGSVDDKEVLDIPEESHLSIAHAGSGLPMGTFELYSSIAIIEANIGLFGDEVSEDGIVTTDSVLRGIAKGKTEIVNKNDLLELVTPESMANVGGMDALKDWVRVRKNCYSPEAAEFGIDPPKGIVLAGIPGTGKSLAARAIACELQVPMLKLDVGRLFNSLLGKSEERMRMALKMAESMAPIVLFIDEIDKGLGGIQGSGDSGAGSRILGTLLTWMQEHTAPIFTVVTGNNISMLPPELLRKGRMDEVFFSLMPTAEECLEILDIHIRKRKWDPERFPREERWEVAQYAFEHGYIAAEIEQAVNSALIECFSSDIDLSMDSVLTAIVNMVPLSRTHKDRIDALRVWGENNAKPTSYAHKPKVTRTVRRQADAAKSNAGRKITRLVTRKRTEDEQ
jgi:hypothetical protein